MIAVAIAGLAVMLVCAVVDVIVKTYRGKRKLP